MTGFWIIAAALVAAVLAALLRPLLKPARAFTDDTAASNLRVLRAQLGELDGELAAGRIDAEQAAVARAELERRVLEEGGAGTVTRAPLVQGRGSVVALALAVPAAALALYLHLGNREAMDPAVLEAAKADQHAAAGDIEGAVLRLAAKLQAEPANPDGWALLARTYARMERFEQARDAYAKALEHGRAPDAQLLADYADALAMTQGRRITAEAEALVMKALALDPNHLKSLALAGTAAMARGDHAKAVQHWTRARDHAPPDSELARGISAGIAEARAAGGLPPEAAAPAVTAATSRPAQGARITQGAPVASAASAASAAGSAALQISVDVSPALAAKVPPGATLLVFARAAEGPRMPLAIVRMPAAQLPVQVRLDDSMAMTPQMKLSAFANVVLVARISRSGGATPEPGDLEGESPPRAATGQARITIDRVRP